MLKLQTSRIRFTGRIAAFMCYSEKLQGYVIHNLFSIICVDTTCGNYVRELLSKIRIKSILFLKKNFG